MIKALGAAAIGAVVVAIVIRANRAGKHHRAISIAAVLALAASCVGYVAYLGYFGGAIFSEIQAEKRPDGRAMKVAAVILSGDMGVHAGMGPKIAERLSADGISVIGVNSLTFFRTRRTPQQAAALIAQATARAMALGHVDHVILIGQSFGADMLQAGLAVAPSEVRRHVAMVALVVPGETLSFRASPSNLLSLGEGEEDAIPSARRLGWARTVCIFGREETNSLCPHLSPSVVTRIGLPGGHPLHRDVAALYAVLRSQIDKAVAVL